jgi:hypothetical protein
MAAETATTPTKATPSASNIFLLNPSPSHQASKKFSLADNLPVQLAIVVGSVVLAATCIASLAWMVCIRRRKGRGKLGGGIIGFNRSSRRTGTQRQSFDPSKPGSVYDFGEADSIDGLSLKEKSEVSAAQDHAAIIDGTHRASRNRASFLSPVSPMPALKLDDTQVGSGMRNPTLVAPLPLLSPSVHRGSGWQLRDGRPIDEAALDIEANGARLPRRPSFIERLMTHRSMTTITASRTNTSAGQEDPNGESMSDPAPWQANQRSGDVRSCRMPERSFTTPAALLGGGPMMTPATPVATTGSVLLSALGGAFRRVSQHHQHYTSQARRKFVPSPRQMPIESDFEGTIGANDADLPMARRSKKRQALCGESIRSPSVATPVIANTPQIAGNGGVAKSFARSPLSGQVGNMTQFAGFTPALRGGGAMPTPGQHTPGMAGLGTTWARRMSETAIPVVQPVSLPSSSKANRKSAKMRNWVAETQFAAVPPPDAVSRRGSDISFVISESSMPSVSRQNSVVQWHKEKIFRRQERMTGAGSVLEEQETMKDDLHRMPSINPHFAAITKLNSWLEVNKDAAHADGGATHHDQLLKSPATDYDRSRGAMLWEDIPALPSQSEQKTVERRSKKSAASTSSTSMRKKTEFVPLTGKQCPNDAWVNDDQTEQTARLRTEEQMRKRMRKARRAAKRAARQAAMLEANKAVTSLPAVRQALRETGDTTATSDTNKGQEQAARQRVLAHDGGSYVACDRESAADKEVEWVRDLVTNTPNLNAPMFVQARSPSAVSPAHRQHAVGGRSKKDNRGRGRSVRQSTRRRVVIARPLSPPESPLTSASEYVRSPNVEQHQRRRSSMPTTTVTTASSTSERKPRSFLVESRRGSKDTNVTASSYSLATSASQRSGMSKSRVISLPVCALTPIADETQCEPTNVLAPAAKAPLRRQLPMPPSNVQRGRLSAYEQIALM